MLIPKPLWYLDVDGVLNMVSSNKRPVDVPIENWKTGIARGFVIHWDTRVVDFINRVHDEGRAEFIWLTTWEGQANEFISPLLGLPYFSLPTMTQLQARQSYKFSDVTSWWKWDVIQKDLASRNQFENIIWTDDDLQYACVADKSIKKEMKNWKHVFGISPITDRGLTLEDLDMIERKLTGEKDE